MRQSKLDMIKHSELAIDGTSVPVGGVESLLRQFSIWSSKAEAADCSDVDTLSLLRL